MSYVHDNSQFFSNPSIPDGSEIFDSVSIGMHQTTNCLDGEFSLKSYVPKISKNVGKVE